LWNALRGLDEVADVDVFLLTDLDASAYSGIVDALRNCRLAAVGTARRPSTVPNRVRWLIGGQLPSALWMRDLGEATRRLEAWARPPYDVVWVAQPLASVLLDGRSVGPVIVDRYDIEEQVLWGQVRVERFWHRPYRLANALMNIARWKRFNRKRSQSATRVVVCSEADAKRAGTPSAVVIPNGYERSAGAAAHMQVAAPPPTFLFQGRMTYDPNVDGAGFFAKRVFPRLLERFPDAQLRIVGQTDERIRKLDALANVTVVGYVAAIDDELARSDVVVVPLRFGSGTRIKVLEAFAHGLPVVSTSLGVEGLDVIAGVHALVADNPDEFASACARVVIDESLRLALTSSARRLYETRYTWRSIRDDIGELAVEVAAGY
jgi:glycosyltransferase involved in cell wall biosynthesis